MRMTREQRMFPCDKKDGFEFSVFSWNVLSRVRAYPDAFPYTDPEHLESAGRVQLIKAEIDNNYADVVVLVDMWEDDNDIAAYLEEVGFQVHTFYENGRGILVALSDFKFPGVPEIVEQREGGNHVVTLLLEAPGTPFRRVHLSAAHLRPGPGRETEYWRSLAMSQLLHRMHQYPYPYVIAGDLNSDEDYGTLLARPVSDVYVDDNGNGPGWTTWHIAQTEQLAVTDRILCSQMHCHSISAVPERWRLADPQPEGQMCTALPSSLYPSNHISLHAHFLI